jgi:peptidyl-prolyl cis-trans isomerase C
LKRTVLILAMLIGLFALSACQKGGSTTQGALALVNGQEIARSQFVSSLHESRAGNTEPLPSDPVGWLQVKVAFLDQLVERKLVVQEAARRGTAVSDEQVDEAIIKMQSDWPEGSFESALSERRLSTEALSKAVRFDLLTAQLARDVVLPTIEVTPEQVRSYYRTNADQFSRPEQVRARQILVATEAQAAELLTQLLTGSNFTDLATSHSIAPEARTGGDLGWFGKGQMPEEVEAACFALEPPQISDIIHSRYGYHIFRVEARRPAAVVPLGQVQNQITAAIKQQRLDRAWREFLDSLKTAADIRIDEAQLASIRQEEI